MADPQSPEYDDPQSDPGVQPKLADVVCSFPAIPPPTFLGAAAWAGAIWPYGKTVPGFFNVGGMLQAQGDLTHPPGTFFSSMPRAELDRINAERAACCMPLLEEPGK